MQLSNKVIPTLLALTAASNYKNTDVVRHYGNMTMLTAINSQSKGIGIMSNGDTDEDKIANENTVKRCISNMMIGTSMYFDKVLPQRQANVIAEELLAKYEYRQLKLEDILAICIEIKEGDTFKLTPAAILRQVKHYVSRRETLAIQMSIEQSEANKANFDANFDKRVLKTVRSIKKSEQEIIRTHSETRKFYKP